MATFSTAVLLSFLCLPGASAAGLGSGLIRRQEEEEEVLVHLGAQGDIEGLKQTELTGSRITEHAASASASLVGNRPANEVTTEDKDALVCNVDFPMGRKDSSNCSDLSLHHRILDDGLCKLAAEDVLATLDPNTYDVPREHKDGRPQGCFITECNAETGAAVAKDDETGRCVFYNPIGDEPRDPVGIPICTRPKYLNGTANTNGRGSDCPAGYSVVTDHDKCMEIAGCLDDSEGDPFEDKILKNNSRHNEYPQGCYLDHEDGKVYFNPEIEGFGLPTKPVGTPLCNVTTFTKCQGAHCGSMRSNLVVTGRIGKGAGNFTFAAEGRIGKGAPGAANPAAKPTANASTDASTTDDAATADASATDDASNTTG